MYLCAVNNILAEIMPRQERLQSATGIYHVMLRGINKQDIFEDDEDYSQFLKWIMRTVPKFLIILGRETCVSALKTHVSTLEIYVLRPET